MQGKTLLTLILLLAITLQTVAQIQKGDLLLGGTVGFNNGSYPASSYSNAGISPHIAMAVSNQAAIGFGIGANYSATENAEKSVGISGSVFYRKYFLIKDKLGWYLHTSATLGWSKDEQSFLDSTGTTYTKTYTNSQNYTLSVTPGLYYQVTPSVLLNADFGGVGGSYSNSGDGWSYNIFVNFFQNFLFGVDFIIGKNRKSPPSSN
ncbi:MAG TPA: hypothetical protein VMI35_12645 [Puia sp.]|nr:hypothetical protein [Puia sp.]